MSRWVAVVQLGRWTEGDTALSKVVSVSGGRASFDTDSGDIFGISLENWIAFFDA
jgi:hypothetical protein